MLCSCRHGGRDPPSQEAEEQKAAAKKVVADLVKERTTCGQHQARVLEVQKELEGAYAKCDTLEQEDKKKAVELQSLSSAC